jgi:alkylhydroperoxidase/carboxymuconolactone decarboxylase family protein YurZ
MRKRLAGAREAGASEDEVLETLYLAMRAAAAHVRQQAFIAMEEVLGEIPSLDKP